MRAMRQVVHVLALNVAALAALAGQAQALTVTRALLSGGTLVVSGYEDNGSTAIRWEGRVVTRSDQRGGFTFTTTVVPEDCTGTLSDGASAIGVGIEGCTVESLPSMRTRKSAGLWSRRLRAKSGGTSMPTEARPDTISARSASRDPTNRFTSK